MSIRTTLVLLSLLAAACGEGTGPDGGGDGQLTARIDGEPWASDAIYLESGVVHNLPGLYLIQGTEVSGSEARSIMITLSNIRGPGTYPLGMGGGTVGGVGHLTDAGAGWLTPLSGASGTITITTLTDTRIVGTFAFTAVGATGGASGTRTVTDGKFDLAVTTSAGVGELPPEAGSRVSAELNGAGWNASTVALQALPAVVWGFSASNTEYALSVAVNDVTGPGTYPLTTVGQIAIAAVTAGNDAPENCCWGFVGGVSGDGEIIIETWTGTRATGTFSFQLPATGGSGATAPMNVLNGTFDVGIPQVP